MISLYTYLSVNNLLYGLQSGFRRSHSTESALIRLVDQLLFELDQDKVSGLLCVDYSKSPKEVFLVRCYSLSLLVIFSLLYQIQLLIYTRMTQHALQALIIRWV